MSAEPRYDFYFSAAEAFGDYFASKFDPKKHGHIVAYRTAPANLLIWATEVTAPGAKPVSRSTDLVCVARNVRAEFIGRRAAKQGDLWGDFELKEACAHQA